LKPKRFYQFGEFTLDAGAKVLLRHDQPVHLTMKAVETLLVLVENAGQVVTKEELMEAVWPGRVVEEANLVQNIAVIRRTLGAPQGSPASIETFPGRGYRLPGPVTLVEHPPTTVAPGGGTPWWRLWRWGVPVLALMATAVTWLVLRRDAPPAEVPFHVSPVTRLAGNEFQPEISDDGRQVAFLWTPEDAKIAGVWTQVVGETTPHPVTSTPGHYSSPTWSADGRSLAYLRIETAATELLVGLPDGSPARLVARLAPPNYGLQYRLMDWSRDGRWFVVAHSDAPGKPLGLVLVSAVTGETRKLTEPRQLVGGDVDPRFSPDGSTISFIRLIHRSHQELFAIPAGGGEARPLTADEKQISAHDWMPDGRTIVFASDRDGEFRVWKVPTGPAVTRRTPVALGIFGEYRMQLSSAGGAPMLVYSSLREVRNIWQLDLPQKHWTRVIASSGQDASPQYSPTGDRICFRSDRSGEEQLWVSRADGSSPVQVTRGPLWPSVGRWSPDGAAIVFNNSRTRDIFVAHEDAGAWRVRPTGARGVHPVFSRDGAWIYAGGDTHIVRMPVSGGPATEVAKTPGISLGVSADGQSLYFMREPNETSLWRLSLASGQIAKLLDGLVPGCSSCWASTAEGIYYLGASGVSFDAQMLCYHDLKTGRSREILPYPEPLTPLGSGPFSISPDGRRLLCVRTHPAGTDVMRVTPFR
jgi:Tol biopolymer transport system component/DNA-binding winged helix-turn-helix (wHTH) protein